MPSDYRRCDLIADRIAEHRGMPRTAANPPLYLANNLVHLLPVMEECHLLSPVQPYHDTEPVFLSQIEKPTRGTCVDPYNVEPMFRHLGKILLDNFTIKHLLSIFTDHECSIADTLHPEFFCTYAEELPSDDRAVRKVRSLLCSRLH